MKLAEIKKLAEVDSRDAMFFKELYRNCVKAIEMVPEEFIKEAFDKALQSDSEVRQLLVGTRYNATFVSICSSNYKKAFWNSEEEIEDGLESNIARYGFKEVMFEAEAIWVIFPLRKNVGLFDMADDNWTSGMTEVAIKMEMRRIFGKYLLSYENAVAEVSEEFFTN